MNNKSVDQFDAQFYAKAYDLDLQKTKMSPFVHYNKIGMRFGNLPSTDKFKHLYPNFDPVCYAKNNPDLINQGIVTNEQLMRHFHHYGHNEGRVYSNTVKPTKRDQSTPNNKYLHVSNISKISRNHEVDMMINIDNSLLKIINDKNTDKPIYLVICEWGYPPYGGGECWMIDTCTWMRGLGFDTYYIYFYDQLKSKNFDHVEVNHHNGLTFIGMPKDITHLLKFVSLLDPTIIANQGINRMTYLRVANLLNKPFITGFCFWQDIINMSGSNIINQHMIENVGSLKPDNNFEIIHNNSITYVAGKFMYDIVEKLHHIPMEVINTISDESKYKVTKYENDVYVTVINICGLKGGNILESIINNTSLEIPFILVDSQEQTDPLNQHLKKILIERNNGEKKNKSVYMGKCQSDMVKIYQQTRILLIPTLVDETFCRVGYEGMMNSIPILSTTNGNLHYLLEGYAEFLDENPKSWSDKINMIYNNPEILESMKHRQKTINLGVDREKYTNLVYKSLTEYNSSYSEVNSVGIVCPWGDQGLGIQCREYYDILTKCGFKISIFSFKPYHATPDNPKLQADPTEWNYPNIYYHSEVREKIDVNDFIKYLHTYHISKMIIVETCYPKVFELAHICHMLQIKVIAIPNLETMRYNEIYQHNIFDKIVCNNQMTYNLLSKYYPNKVSLIGFRILNKNFTLQKKWDNNYSFFCSGGLNSLTRKNIDKILKAFKDLENEHKINNFKLYVYVQGVEVPHDIEKYRSDNIIFKVGQQSYHDIVDLYKKHDIFIHMGDHEGLGLGFYESITCGTPVMTINTSPNNEIIHEGVNGWCIPCGYSSMEDNKDGLIYRASISSGDIKQKMREIIDNYDRQRMYRSTILDYIHRYPIDQYTNQMKHLFDC